MKTNKLLMTILILLTLVAAGILIMLLGRAYSISWLRLCGEILCTVPCAVPMIIGYVRLIKYLLTQNRLVVTLLLIAVIFGGYQLSVHISSPGISLLGLEMVSISFITGFILMVIWSFKSPGKEAVQESGKDTKISSFKFSTIVPLCMYIVIIFVFLYMGSSYINDIEHYRRVYNNPLSVTATVVDHDFYTVRNKTTTKTRYRSYISYTVDGIRYSEIIYENSKNSQDDLTPIGTAVNLLVSPEDPAKLMSSLQESGQDLNTTLLVLLVYIIFSKKFFSSLLPSKNTPEPKGIQTDNISAVKHRYTLPGLILYCIASIILYCRYAMILGIWPLIFAVISAVCVLWFLKDAIRSMYYPK